MFFTSMDSSFHLCLSFSYARTSDLVNFESLLIAINISTQNLKKEKMLYL